MDLSRTVSELNGDFGGKSQTFSHPRVFNDPAEVRSCTSPSSLYSFPVPANRLS